jgi:hypothetical protein
MPIQLEQFPHESSDELIKYLDGGIYKFSEEEVERYKGYKTFRSRLYHMATARGLKIRTRVTTTGFVFQTYKAEE